jgi:hypothetical protein
MKCLEKDRARRYETASGLALDVERHLNNEPVTAAAPGHWYRLQKFVRRHRIGLAMTSGPRAAVDSGDSGQHLAGGTRDKSRARANTIAPAGAGGGSEPAGLKPKSRQVAKFLTDMLEGVGRPSLWAGTPK